jgi:hypothetical protein
MQYGLFGIRPSPAQHRATTSTEARQKKKTPARQRKTNQFHSSGQAKSRIFELKPKP